LLTNHPKFLLPGAAAAASRSAEPATASAFLAFQARKKNQMTDRRIVVAIDVGGTKIVSGLFLETGEILHEKTVPTARNSAEESVSQIVQLVQEACGASAPDPAPAGVGIAVPGWVNQRERTVWAPNLCGWDHLPLQSMLEERLQLSVFLDSDRSAYVKGESWLGIAQGLTDVVFLAVGTGIGAGILSGGRVLRGYDDLAGAVGWLALNPVFQDLYSQRG
jgi:glucokinase